MRENKPKIVMVTGSYPPVTCGVGDYTFKLLDHLKENKNYSVVLFYRSQWNLSCFTKYLKQLKSEKANFYHFQYPTEGYGYSLVPLLLVLVLPRKKIVITVHELSSRNILAYMYTQILISLSRTVIVPNEMEKKYAGEYVFNKNKIKIIPIASNIPVSRFSEREFHNRNIDLAYFGHIRPLKGIEEFIETISLLSGKTRVAIVGQSLEKYLDFFEHVKEQAKYSNIEIIENKPDTEIADILADVKIVYLPFPDGVSNRRGSLLAAVQNNCTIVTTRSGYEKFNVFFEKYCYLVKSKMEGCVIIEKLLNGELEIKNINNLKLNFSWENITDLHSDIYQHKNQ